MTSEILGLDPSIKTNADLMVNVMNLGYVGRLVLDATYGGGGFWNKVRPELLVASDIKLTDGNLCSDFTCLPFIENTFDTVVLDGPYKLGGTPSLSEFDERYGIDVPTRWQDRNELIKRGITDCIRVARKYVLIKCQDQVSSGHVRWQTREFTDHAESCGTILVDRFDLLGHRMPQPPGRSQKHARRNTSTLLVMEKK